ncbi:MAG TPA: translation initiation factor IF-2 [Atribacteraceae bacterium]|nr:translation initiation factor IF-2 [Atribacteraceae bacterium]
MAKVRIYKIAEQLGMPTREVMEILKGLGADVKNHMSGIDEELIDLLREERDFQKQKKEEKRKKREKTITLQTLPVLKEMARLLDISVGELVIELSDKHIIFDSSTPLPPLVVERLILERDWEVEWKDGLREETLKALHAKKETRPPIVTILGHVDHGKTTLLDVIRKTRVANSEVGGITQKIGAYQIEINGRKITFIDTPGHEAFTTMRARGAQVTDIAVLMVAADDGVMPQTSEAIQHARAAAVPIIVAINKMDKPGVNPDRVKQQLADQGLIPEEWGGDVICVNISALQGKGISELLDMILLQADLLELQAAPRGFAIGTIIESRLDRGKGPVATVLVQEGILRVGDFFVSGSSWGKVRAMTDDRGKGIREAPPSSPVELAGFSELPLAGTRIVVVEDEKMARLIGEQRMQGVREKMLGGAIQRASLEELLAPEKGEARVLNIVLKADLQGSAEALEKALGPLAREGVSINLVSRGVGNINEADILLASASSGIVVGFNVKALTEVLRIAKQEGVDVRLYRIIYDVVDDIDRAIQGLVTPEMVEEVTGKAEVRAIFRMSRIGTVAGSYVVDGKIERNALVRVIRQGEIICRDEKISSLKRFKDDVRDVALGYECGIGLEHFADFKEGDMLEVYRIREKK